jgi:hypothetical protein
MSPRTPRTPNRPVSAGSGCRGRKIDARDYFDEHILPELRVVRRGTRTVLVPVAELVRWVERNAARCSA